MKIVFALISGTLFGFGLALSGMTDPAKVIGFLDVTGAWDPSLAFVMGCALLVSLPAFQLARRRRDARPWFSDRFAWPTIKTIDRRGIEGFGADIARTRRDGFTHEFRNDIHAALECS